MIEKINDKKGTGYIETIIIILASMLVIALAVKVYPVFIAKDQLNTLAEQTLREAQLEGRIQIDYARIAEVTIDPDTVDWEASTFNGNKVQFGENIEITVTKQVDLGFFEFGSFPITLKSKARGKSEVYWK